MVQAMHGAIIFLMVLGICLGIYTSTYKEFNLNGASTTYVQFTQVIGQNTTGAELQQTLNSSVTTGQTVNCNNLTLGCASNNGQSVYCATGNFFGLLVPNPICAITCFFNPSDSICPSQNIIVSNTPKLFNSNVQNVQATSNNIWLKITGNPLDDAVGIMGVFIALGILAGLFGAGILARVMASVGIGLAVIVYIEGSLTVFTGLPSILYIGFNGIIGMLLLIIAWDSFNAPGGAT